MQCLFWALSSSKLSKLKVLVEQHPEHQSLYDFESRFSNEAEFIEIVFGKRVRINEYMEIKPSQLTVQMLKHQIKPFIFFEEDPSMGRYCAVLLVYTSFDFFIDYFERNTNFEEPFEQGMSKVFE